MELKTGPGSNLEQSKNHSSLEYPSGSSIGKEKFFISTPSLVSRNLQNELPAEPNESDTMINGSKTRVENIVVCHEEVNDKMQKALKSLNFRYECNLIQFWAPCSDGKYVLLKTVDQPFHLGKPDDGLCSYRRESERNWFLVDEKCDEKELNPVARVFRRQLPEGTSDVMNHHLKKYPLHDCAIRFNLHGYLVLPVFDSDTMLCVGVLEFITYLKHLDCAYEVQEVHRTLKAVNLTSPQAFDCPTSYFNYKNRQHELDDCISSQLYHKNFISITNSQKTSANDVSSKKIDMSAEEEMFTSGRRKRKTDSVGSVHIQNDIEKSISEASSGSVSRDILNFTDSVTVHEFNAESTDFCNSVPKNWTSVMTKSEKIFVDDATSKKIDFVSGEEALTKHKLKPKLDNIIAEAEHKQKYSGKPIDEVSRSSAIINTHEMAVADVIAEKTDVATVGNRYDSERKGVLTKRRRKRKMDSVSPQMIQQYFGQPIGEASTRLGVSRSTLKRVCRELNIPRWPFPQRNNCFHLSLSVVIRLLIRVKRWSCSISNHGFSAKWWICGKHNAFAFKSNQSYDSQKGETICDSIDTVIPFSKPRQACFGIYEAACLLLGLKHWRKRTIGKRPRLCSDGGISEISILNAFPNKNVVNVSDTTKVTVKATYKDDMVKFDFYLSSGLWELKKQVAQRIKLQETRFHLKYKDEDDDLILIACDDDLCSLVPFSATSASNKNTMKLIVEMANG
uniref:protein NLP6-like n=1 Tax=Erigeron canadensis TaxID=72917 RepID=UPI001CB99B98|nr:protein NLP6-like [Erigeron canadensis]